jgi:hypothetical protein
MHTDGERSETQMTQMTQIGADQKRREAQMHTDEKRRRAGCPWDEERITGGTPVLREERRAGRWWYGWGTNEVGAGE